MLFISLSPMSLPNTEISDDVVVHMTNQMNRLSKRMQAKLKCCACLGPCFDTEILRKAIRETDFNINSFLESSLEDGFFQHIVDDRYKWAHDQVQQAAYDSCCRMIFLSSRDNWNISFEYFIEKSFSRTDSFCKQRIIPSTSWLQDIGKSVSDGVG